jgi:hypothetical protein
MIDVLWRSEYLTLRIIPDTCMFDDRFTPIEVTRIDHEESCKVQLIGSHQ